MNRRLTLYYRPGACALAPHIVLNWLGWDYQAVNAPRDESYKSINPTGAVPALQYDDGKVLTQAGAILHYLAEASDQPRLLGGADARARSQVSQWTSFFTGDFHPAFFPVFVPHRYTTIDSDEAREATRAAGLLLVQNGLDQIEGHLADKPAFVGAEKSIADAYAVPMLRWANMALADKLEPWPSTSRFYRKMCSDAGVVDAMAVHGISPD